jgi:hypothetical protein
MNSRYHIEDVAGNVGWLEADPSYHLLVLLLNLADFIHDVHYHHHDHS